MCLDLSVATVVLMLILYSVIWFGPDWGIFPERCRKLPSPKGNQQNSPYPAVAGPGRVPGSDLPSWLCHWGTKNCSRLLSPQLGGQRAVGAEGMARGTSRPGVNADLWWILCSRVQRASADRPRDRPSALDLCHVSVPSEASRTLPSLESIQKVFEQQLHPGIHQRSQVSWPEGGKRRTEEYGWLSPREGRGLGSRQ